MSIELVQRSRVVREARRWLGTPYHHRARRLGVGVDCAQLPCAVYEAAGVIEEVKPEYVQDWHLHKGEEQYLAWIIRCGGREIPRSQAQPGDLGVWRWGRTFSHGAIVVEPHMVIHAWVGIGVTLDDMDSHEELRTRDSRFFTLWGA